MNPDRNNDSSVLFRWKEFSMSLNLTAKEFKQGELFIRETIRSRRKIVNFLLFSTRSDGKKNASFRNNINGLFYRSNRSVENRGFLTDYLSFTADYIFLARMAVADQLLFASVISRKLLPRHIHREFSWQITRVNVFTDEKSRLAWHIILRNEISWILIGLSFRTQSGCYISCPTVHFGCSFQIVKLILVNPRGLTKKHWHFSETVHYFV